MSEAPISRDIRSVISLLELAGGRWLSDSPGGRMITPCGRVPHLVNRSALPAAAADTKTNDISPLPGSNLSVSADLQRSLESKLQARLVGIGSPIYAMNWKQWDMRSGPPICALRALAPRTSGKDCSSERFGWHTPLARDGDKLDATPPAIAKRMRDGREIGLAMEARMCSLAGWPTPCTPSGGRSTSTEKMDATGRTPDGKKHTASLEHAVKFSGPTRITADGAVLTGSDAQMASSGQLNPEHSRWLMGYPAVWGSSGVLAMQSSRKSRRSSSKPSAKLSESDVEALFG